MMQLKLLFLIAFCAQLLPATRQQHQPEVVTNSNSNSNITSNLSNHLKQTILQAVSIGQNDPNGIKFSAPSQGQLSQHRQMAQVGQMLLNGVQQLTAASPLGPMMAPVSIGTPNHLQSLLIASRSNSSSGLPGSNVATHHLPFNEQGEILRQEIINRANQLQQVVSTSLGSLRNNSDLIVKRLLEQMSVRLDQARAKADRIISEPTNNEIAVKALATINNGLTNVNNIIINLVRRIEQPIQQQNNNNNIDNNIDHNNPNNNKKPNESQPPEVSPISQRIGSNTGTGTSNLEGRFPFNLNQLRQQFSSAIAAVKQQQQPSLQKLTNNNSPN